MPCWDPTNANHFAIPFCLPAFHSCTPILPAHHPHPHTLPRSACAHAVPACLNISKLPAVEPVSMQ